MKKQNRPNAVKSFIVILAITLAVGGLAAALTMGSMEKYELLEKPVLSPPTWVFPVVWSLLYILMAISAWLVYISDSPLKRRALTLYAIQLAVNFVWPLLFFNAGAYLLAFFWLIALLLLVIAMTLEFSRIRPLGARLQIPYLLWTAFAGWLNYMIYALN